MSALEDCESSGPRDSLASSCDCWAAEALLLLFIVYLVFVKRPSKPRGPELTKKEVQELVEDWKPAPLVPALTEPEQKLVDRLHASPYSAVPQPADPLEPGLHSPTARAHVT